MSTPTRPSPYTRSPVTAPEPGAGSSPTATFFPSAATSASSAHTAAAKREALMRRRDSTPVFASGVDVSREGFDELERADRQRPTTMLQEDVEAIAEVGAAEEALAEPPSTLYTDFDTCLWGHFAHISQLHHPLHTVCGMLVPTFIGCHSRDV